MATMLQTNDTTTIEPVSIYLATQLVLLCLQNMADATGDTGAALIVMQRPQPAIHKDEVLRKLSNVKASLIVTMDRLDDVIKRLDKTHGGLL